MHNSKLSPLSRILRDSLIRSQRQSGDDSDRRALSVISLGCAWCRLTSRSASPSYSGVMGHVGVTVQNNRDGTGISPRRCSRGRGRAVGLGGKTEQTIPWRAPHRVPATKPAIASEFPARGNLTLFQDKRSEPAFPGNLTLSEFPRNSQILPGNHVKNSCSPLAEVLM